MISDINLEVRASVCNTHKELLGEHQDPGNTISRRPEYYWCQVKRCQDRADVSLTLSVNAAREKVTR